MESLISIVDDDEPVREALRRILTSHGLTAAVFASARQLLDSDQLDHMSCLIVDGKMPGMSGFALHRQLVAAGRRIPTILITGCPTASGRKRALAAGVVSYLAKPFSEEILLDNIRLALARGGAGEPAAVGNGAEQVNSSGSNPPMGSGDRTRRPASVTHLKRLEAESIAILREAAAEFRNPVLMYSIGKDSSVLLHLARKAFHPAKLPLPLLHVDTNWKFRVMIEFRDTTVRRLGLELIVHVNQEGLERGINPI